MYWGMSVEIDSSIENLDKNIIIGQLGVMCRWCESTALRTVMFKQQMDEVMIAML